VESKQADNSTVVSTVLFYLAKKRSWEVRATLRRSAKKVVTALTPRRSEFPSSVKQGRPRRLNDDDDIVPPTPKVKASFKDDLEKGNSQKKMANFEVRETKEAKKPMSKWSMRSDR
jgi:hypothetical protein